MREFTLYLSTRWDMTLERAAFKSAAAPALKQMLDARGVSFGYMDPRSDLGVEDLRTPKGIDAVLVRTDSDVEALRVERNVDSIQRKKIARILFWFGGECALNPFHMSHSSPLHHWRTMQKSCRGPLAGEPL